MDKDKLMEGLEALLKLVGSLSGDENPGGGNW